MEEEYNYMIDVCSISMHTFPFKSSVHKENLGFHWKQ